MDLLINIDVPCLARGIEFYENAFGLTVTRRLGAEAAELSGWPARLYLLEKQAGSVGADNRTRPYDRHWNPLHLHLVVQYIQDAVTPAVAGVAPAETEGPIGPLGPTSPARPTP